ncbi:hypothetical protein EYC59_04610 [Candidatus Saccharibacteria bacterium]|nr:MAG: hypothetical protein EYC59_04610 [Candidatus Saccharibacteria bacterium]
MTASAKKPNQGVVSKTRHIAGRVPSGIWMLAGVVVFALVGTVLLAISKAATPVASYEVESGTKSGNATTVSDSGASGSSAVKFSSTGAQELKGWELTPTNIGLAPFGLSCSTLPPYTGSNTPEAGTVISGKLISTNLYLIKGAVTIEKSCIRPTGSGPHGLISTWDPNNCPNSCATAKGQVIIRDSEIDGSLIPTQQIAYTGAFMGVGILERNYFHDIGSGIGFYNTGPTYTASAVNNYIHKLRAYGNAATTGSHNESATVRDYDISVNPNRQLTFRGNYMTSDSGNDTGALFLQAYSGFIGNVTVENNLLSGGGYQLILEYKNYGYGNLKSINNRYSGTGYGPGYVTGGVGWAQWTDNYRYDATKTDGKGTAVNEP